MLPPATSLPYDADRSAPPCSPGLPRNCQIAYGGSAYAPPVSRKRLCKPVGTSRVVTFTTPPSAADPYSDEPAPFRTSTPSILSTASSSQSSPPRSSWFLGTPSTV